MYAAKKRLQCHLDGKYTKPRTKTQNISQCTHETEEEIYEHIPLSTSTVAQRSVGFDRHYYHVEQQAISDIMFWRHRLPNAEQKPLNYFDVIWENT